MRVPRDAWKTGAVWRATTKRGALEAIVIKKDVRQDHKIIEMTYLDGPRAGVPVRQPYSHKHMLKYFQYTGETKPVKE